jgi:hypothetical protein
MQHTENIEHTIRFDWYSATVMADYSDLWMKITKWMDADPQPHRPMFGFEHAIGFFKGERRCALLMWSKQGDPHVQASGWEAQQLFEMLERHFAGRYSVARADCAVDFSAVGWFDVVQAQMLRQSLSMQVTNHMLGDWDTPGSPVGRTRYAGRRTSKFYRRVYEHKKLHGYGADGRYEVECKPPSREKQAFAGMTASQMLRLDLYSVRLLRSIGIDIRRLRPGIDERPDFPGRWFQVLVRQYGPKLLALVEAECGGDLSDVGVRIHREFERQAREREDLQRMVREIPQADRQAVPWSDR